jgi:signal transduction histidine kinase
MLLDKDAILGALGHDLRTPLTALRIRAENLDPSVPRDRMIEAVNHLTHIVNGILDLSKIGGNKEPAVPTDLTALITTIVEEFEDMGADVQLMPGPRSSAILRPPRRRGLGPQAASIAASLSHPADASEAGANRASAGSGSGRSTGSVMARL